MAQDCSVRDANEDQVLPKFRTTDKSYQSVVPVGISTGPPSETGKLVLVFPSEDTLVITLLPIFFQKHTVI